MLALVLALLQAPAPAPTLEALTQEAAPIALVRVEEVRAITQSNGRIDARLWPEKEIRVARCAVERMLLGPPQRAQVFVALRVPGAEAYEVAVGERFVVFGDSRGKDFHPSATTAKRLEQFSAGAGVFTPLAGGLWRVEMREQREVVVWPLSIAALPKSLDERRVAAELPLPALLDWLDQELERTTPTVEACVVSTAPLPWHVVVRADGTWDASDFTTQRVGKLEPSQWAQLRQQIVDQPVVGSLGAFGERGVSLSPCLAWSQLRLRRRDGVWTIRLGELAADADPTLRDAIACARRLWDALPGRDEPPKAR